MNNDGTFCSACGAIYNDEIKKSEKYSDLCEVCEKLLDDDGSIIVMD